MRQRQAQRAKEVLALSLVLPVGTGTILNATCQPPAPFACPTCRERKLGIAYSPAMILLYSTDVSGSSNGK